MQSPGTPQGSGSRKFFRYDLVQKVSDPESIGVVYKCWHTDDSPEQVHGILPQTQPLGEGEVAVSFSLQHGVTEYIHEDEIRLVDRAFQPGDYCKRSLDDLRSGIITRHRVRGRLCHSISREPLEGWFTAADLKERAEAQIGDYVAYDDWIGQVVEVFGEHIIEVPTGKLVRLPELGSRLTVGDRGPNVLPPPDAGLQQFLSLFTQHGEGGTVLYSKHNTLAIAWLALNQTLDPAESENRPRPARYWYGENMCKLTLLLGPTDQEVVFNSRVELRNDLAVGKPVTRHGQETDPTGVLSVQIYSVYTTQTEVDVLWQDGSRETLMGIDIVPYLFPEENDCWPGDHAIFRVDDDDRLAIIQSVNEDDRTASLLFPDTGNIELATTLDLDLNGTSDEPGAPDDSVLTPHLGDWVFIHKPGTTNGLQSRKMPIIGEMESWVHERGNDADNLPGWRRAMHNIGSNIATQRGLSGFVEKPVQLCAKGSGKLNWFGEVTAMNLDGTVEVTHPDFSVAVYPTKRLTLLIDTVDEGMDAWNSDADDDDVWEMDESGNWLPAPDLNDWEDVSDDGEDIVSDTSSHKSSHKAETEIAQPPTVEAAVEDEDAMEDQWASFKILPSAPIDHSFYKDPPGQPSKSFLGRLRKEYRILDGSLPNSILIRAYEDRTDLLRSLIIGPENTPYVDAPFVIDWVLPSDFPVSPPKAFFHSWTNGNGRVNPNLYEEGKVCLSLLGTWSGQQTEVWHPLRSSLLQVLVSIQGLVLVREPWYCEPGFEKLAGTSDALRKSRYYNETVYNLSRLFVHRALEQPPMGFERELTYFYHQQGHLHKVIDEAEALLAKSSESKEASDQEWDISGLARLTTGGIIQLERILKKLRKFQRPLSASSAYSKLLESTPQGSSQSRTPRRGRPSQSPAGADFSLKGQDIPQAPPNFSSVPLSPI